MFYFFYLFALLAGDNISQRQLSLSTKEFIRPKENKQCFFVL